MRPSMSSTFTNYSLYWDNWVTTGFTGVYDEPEKSEHTIDSKSKYNSYAMQDITGCIIIKDKTTIDQVS